MDDAQVTRIADLARLDLAVEESAAMAAQLTRILDYIDQLNRLDTSAVEPTTNPIELGDVFREDEVRPSLPTELALANAPATDGAFFIVPRVI
ncbi:MAG: Asp-tRNA(Asn)/Glu-tRNA(Gln) amidotransferase subunit GatC [Nitrospirota bacterium]|jgi:aspartyl-tRNA(Asn)/glutamyl-tRNA(Gln) amidotransferase subunit C